jgi:uncharacterized protein (TIGR02646 family)
MIRVKKTDAPPASLTKTDCNSYNGEDVREMLYADQYGKCYLCEQKTTKSFEIEHLRSKAEGFFPHLKYKWTNLFLACPYCNGRKPNQFTELPDPSTTNIEEVIEQRISFPDNKIELKTHQTDIGTIQSIGLLDMLLNGKKGIRDFKCQLLYKDIIREINFFMGLLDQYRSSQDPSLKQAICDNLEVSKEFLGLKYWIIKDNTTFLQEFGSHILWNKTHPGE